MCACNCGNNTFKQAIWLREQAAKKKAKLESKKKKETNKNEKGIKGSDNQ